MKAIRALIILGAASMIFVDSSAAFELPSFGRKKDKEEYRESHDSAENRKLGRRYHLHIPDEKTESELMNMFQQKKLLTQEITVLQGLNRQKAKQYQNVQMSLQQIFQILPEVKYQYNKDDMTIYELVPEGSKLDVQTGSGVLKGPRTTDEPANSYALRVHRKLENEVQANRMLKLTRDRNLIHDQLYAIQSILVEKEYAMSQLDEVMAAKFSLSKDAIYNYDEEKMVLYEIVQQPQRDVPLRDGDSAVPWR